MNETNYTLLSDWHIIWLVREWEKAVNEWNRRMDEELIRFSNAVKEYDTFHKEMNLDGSKKTSI